MPDLTFADGFGLVQLVLLGILAYFFAEPARDLLRAVSARSDHGLLAHATGRVVAMVEQTMAQATGPEKLERAIIELHELAALYGIDLSEAQATVLIEAAVNNLRTWSLDIEGDAIASIEIE